MGEGRLQIITKRLKTRAVILIRREYLIQMLTETKQKTISDPLSAQYFLSKFSALQKTDILLP